MPTQKILSGIHQFQDRFREDPDRLVCLATEGQRPQVLFITCSDSRVAPELITSAELGDLYVVRAMGNLVPPFGTGEVGIGAALEHAIFHLRVRHLVVCGHTQCGCLQALDTPPDWSREPHISRWIEHARPARTKAEASGLPAQEQPLATVRENVLLHAAAWLPHSMAKGSAWGRSACTAGCITSRRVRSRRMRCGPAPGGP